jgi:TRAP-type C4-dicarboxylate transport system permease small subunit
METLTQILLIIGAGIIAWFSYKAVKRNPQAFSGENINKSFFTLGLLALFLIGIIALLVVMLK